MQIGILGNPGSWYFNALSRAAETRGHSCVRLDFHRLATMLHRREKKSSITGGETDLLNLDVLIVRTMPPGSLEQVVFRMNVLAQCEAAGIVVLNPPRAMECAVDKYLTTAKLLSAGLPVPETFVCESAETALEAFEKLGGDVVVKPIFGSEGRGILRVSDPDLALRTFRTLERIQAVLYLQKFIEHDGSDIRVLLFDGDVLGAMRRISADDFRVNISRNGHAEKHDPTDCELDFARQAMTATGTRFGGVDILYDRDGEPYVIEINAVPGWRALERVEGRDIAAEVIQRLEHEKPQKN